MGRKVIITGLLLAMLMLLVSCSSSSIATANNTNPNIDTIQNYEYDDMMYGKKHNEELHPDDLMGLWHASNMLPAGWHDVYLFYIDGSFVFDYNQMDLKKRILSYSGQWEIQSSTLILEVETMVVIFDGQIVESSELGEELVNGVEKTIELDIPIHLEYELGDIRHDPETIGNRESLAIEGVKYWKFKDATNDFYFQKYSSADSYYYSDLKQSEN